MESVGQYLMAVSAGAVICGVLEKLQPKSAILKMMCGVFMVLTAVSPWLKIPVYDFTQYAQSFSQQAAAASDLGREEAEEYKRAIIKEKVCTYILDKAAQLDLCIDAEVTLAVDEENIPCAVRIIGEVPKEKMLQLQHILETELGIGRADQFWTE